MKTILVVEDCAVTLLLMQSKITKMGHLCVLAIDGVDGLIKFNNKIDLVITDYNMPNMNGGRMAKEIREINKKIPIILITSENINDILHDKDLTDNTNEIIEKPVCEPILKKLIEKYL